MILVMGRDYSLVYSDHTGYSLVYSDHTGYLLPYSDHTGYSLVYSDHTAYLLPYSDHTGSGDYPDSYHVDTVDFVPGNKAAGSFI
jgi:hypothetical protein